MNIKINFKYLLLFGIFLISSIVWTPVQAQIAPNAGISIKINTPVDSDTIPVGDLTIQGTSSDDDTTNCQVYTDWNDLKPMQNVTPSGPKGNADYSSWSFTYSGSYHDIVEGPNELTSKITCYDQGQNASSKFYSVNVTGTTDGNENTNNTVQESSENTDNDASNILPVKNNNSDSADKTVQESSKNTDNDASNILPVKNNNSDSADKTADKTVQESSENTDNDANNILPVKNKNSDSADKTADKTVQKSSENTDNDVSNVLPVKNNNSNGTYKILPLYSESNEESIHAVASQDSDKTEQVTSTDTSESQDSEELNDTDTNTYFTFESEQEEGEELSANNDNTISNSPQSDNPLSNYYHDDGNSVFGLNFKDLDEDTENKLENRMEKLKERIADRMPLFDLIG